MTKGARIIISILLAVFLLLSLPILYLCVMNIFIGLTHGANSNYLPILTIASAIIILLDIIAIIGLIKVFKKTCYENGRTQTDEALADANERRKYLQNWWFIAPLILPSICFVLNALTEFMFWLMYDANIEQRAINALAPYLSAIFAIGNLSGVLIILATIPLAIISIVLTGIKKISLTEMFVSFGSYFFVFFFVAIVIGSRG